VGSLVLSYVFHVYILIEMRR